MINARKFAAAGLLATALGLASCGGNSNRITAVFSQGDALTLRVGEAVEAAIVAQPVDGLYSISPPLPDGLVFDSTSAAISGAALLQSATQTYSIRHGGEPHSTVDIGVWPELPSAFESLDRRFSAEVLIDNASAPVRMAMAPDGRVFYAELAGNVRVIDPQQGLLPTPFANIPVVSGAETGLLGLALDPDFSNNGYVYLHATVPGSNGAPARAQIIRLYANHNIGTDLTVLVDDLPVAEIHNGGEIVFDRDGNFFVGRGDIGDPISAQTSGDLAGKILRYTRDGAIPADNPYPGDPEWARGLRNTFAMTLQPQTGELFGADAGPTVDDKLNYLVAGKNFTWGMEAEPEGSDIGFSIRIWPEVITPTALQFHSGNGVDEFANNLFLASYNDETILRLVLTGDQFTDFIREVEFARFAADGIDNKPLHLIELPHGGFYISTFNAIYHVYPNATAP